MITLLYGDEPQLIEERKQGWLESTGGLPVSVFNEEAGPAQITGLLREDSLFGDQRALCLINLPIFRKPGKKYDNEWDKVYEALLHYDGTNPVLLVYHDTIDRRTKANTAFISSVTAQLCKKLTGDEVRRWIEEYCRKQGFRLTADGRQYLFNLLELWQDVPISFLRTEFDRYFLLLEDKKVIDAQFMIENGSDFGAKNIFTFKDALLRGDAAVLQELFPFMLSYKELDRAMSYIEGQLRLQLMACECRDSRMSERELVELCKKMDSKLNPYPIKLAYEQSRRVDRQALAELLRGLYETVRRSRQGETDMVRFRDLCFTYCLQAGEKKI